MLFVASVCCCCDVRLLTQILLLAAVLPSAVTQWAVNWCVYCVYRDQIGKMEMKRLVLVLATEQQSAAKQTKQQISRQLEFHEMA